jgi:hypothetical protein
VLAKHMDRQNHGGKDEVLCHGEKRVSGLMQR